jgi:hypothetical protein
VEDWCTFLQSNTNEYADIRLVNDLYDNTHILMSHTHQQKAPHFYDARSGRHTHTLSEYAGSGWYCIFIERYDSGCTVEACSFRDNLL